MRCPLSKTCWNSARRLSRRPLSKGRGATSEPGLTWAGLTCVARSGRIRLGRGNREAFASLGPAPFEHQAPFLGAHAHEEPMGARPALAVRLERTLHDVGSPATVERRRRNLNTNEPRPQVSIHRWLSRVAFVRAKSCATVASPAAPQGLPPKFSTTVEKNVEKPRFSPSSSSPRAQ